MNRTKKRGEISMEVIIIAAIALLVLVILSILIIRAGGGAAKGTACDSLGGTCVGSKEECSSKGIGFGVSGNACSNANEVCCMAIGTSN